MQEGAIFCDFVGMVSLTMAHDVEDWRHVDIYYRMRRTPGGIGLYGAATARIGKSKQGVTHRNSAGYKSIHPFS